MRIIVPMTEAMATTIDDFRFATHAPTRASAIRDMIAFALEAYGPVPPRLVRVPAKPRGKWPARKRPDDDAPAQQPDAAE